MCSNPNSSGGYVYFFLLYGTGGAVGEPRRVGRSVRARRGFFGSSSARGGSGHETRAWFGGAVTRLGALPLPHAPVPPLALLGAAWASREWPRRNGKFLFFIRNKRECLVSMNFTEDFYYIKYY